MLRPGARCRVRKLGAYWVVIHVPSEVMVWAKFGPVHGDAIGFATGRKQ